MGSETDQFTDDAENPGIELLTELDALCDRFEAELKAGRRPDVEAAVGQSPPQLREMLRRELTRLMADYDTAAGGEHPTPGGRRRGARRPGDLPEGDIPGQRAIEIGALPGFDSIGDYEVLRVIGVGGMGVVYLARHREIGRVAAVKLLNLQRFSSASAEALQTLLTRFQREVRAAAQLNHPHIITVYEVGEFEGRPYYTMPFVDGPTLAERIASGDMSGRDAARYLMPIAAAVHAMHAAGVMHRDLKPSNILIEKESDRPIVADFGLAKLASENQLETQSGELFGTPAYMAPEQIRDGSAATAATDIYGLGATLYHAIAGRPPFAAKSIVETLDLALYTDPVPPQRVNPSVDRDLQSICLKCLEKEPHRRYGSAQQLADDLKRYLDRRPVRARPIGRLARAYRWARRNHLSAALGAILIAALCVGTAVTSLMYYRTRVAYNERDAFWREGNLQRSKLCVEKADSIGSAVLRPLWLLEAWQADKESPARIEDDRLRMSAALGALPELKSVLFSEQPIFADAMTSDRRLLACGMSDGVIQFWDNPTSQPFLTLRHEGGNEIRALAFSADNRYAISVVHGGTALVWDLESGAPRTGPLWHGKGLLFGAVSAGGGHALTIGGDAGAQLWSLESDPPTARSLNHFGTATSGQFFPGRDLVVTGDANGDMRFWSLDGEPSGEAMHHSRSTRLDVMVSRDGSCLLSRNSSSTVRRWDAQGAPLAKGPLDDERDIIAARILPDSKTVLTVGGAGVVRLWSIADGQPLSVPVPVGQRMHALDVDPSARRLVCCTDRINLSVWDIATGRRIAGPLLQPGTVAFCRFGTSPNELLVGWRAGTVRAWVVRDPEAGEVAAAPLESPTFPHLLPQRANLACIERPHKFTTVNLINGERSSCSLAAEAIELSLNEDTAAIVLLSGQACFVNLSQPELQPVEVPCDFPVDSVQFVSNRRALIAGRKDSRMKVVTLEGKTLAGRDFGSRIESFTRLETSDQVAVAVREGIHICQLADLKTLRILPRGEEIIRKLCCDHRDEILYGIGAAPGIHRWRLGTTPAAYSCIGEDRALLDIQVAASDDTLLTAGVSSTLSIWDVSGATPQRYIPLLPAPATHASYDPTGRYIAVSTSSGVSIYRARGSELVVTYPSRSPVQYLVWGDDRLLAVQESGRLMTISCRPESRSLAQVQATVELMAGFRLNSLGEPTPLTVVETRARADFVRSAEN